MRKIAPAFILSSIVALASGSALALGDMNKDKKSSNASTASTSQSAGTTADSRSADSMKRNESAALSGSANGDTSMASSFGDKPRTGGPSDQGTLASNSGNARVGTQPGTTEQSGNGSMAASGSASATAKGNDTLASSNGATAGGASAGKVDPRCRGLERSDARWNQYNCREAGGAGASNAGGTGASGSASGSTAAPSGAAGGSSGSTGAASGSSGASAGGPGK